VVADQPVHSRTFQATLAALTRQGLIEHRTERVPPDYTLTDSGRRLAFALQHMEEWDQGHPAEQSSGPDPWRN
jgi:DNA-binding HxlR family transcriptional regulator